MSDLPAVIAAYFECMNAEDWARLPSLFAPDATLIAVGTRPRSGRDEVIAYYPKILNGWTRHLDEPTRWLVDGQAVAVEIHFEGQDRHGTAHTFEAVDIFDLRNGRICRLTNWYDVLSVNRALERSARAAAPGSNGANGA